MLLSYKVSPEEWEEYWSNMKDEEGKPLVAGKSAMDLEVFKMLDLDNSGLVTRSEYKHLADLYKETAFDETFDDVHHEL